MAEEMDGERKEHNIGEVASNESDAVNVDEAKQDDTREKEKKTERQGKLMTVEERAVGGVDS